MRKQATDGIVFSLALPQQAFESADHNSGAGRLEVHALPASSAPDFSLGDVEKMASRRLRHVLPDNWAPPMADVRILLTDKAIARLPTPKEGWYLARDIELKGFFVIVGKRKSTFTVQGDLRQRRARSKITSASDRAAPRADWIAGRCITRAEQSVGGERLFRFAHVRVRASGLHYCR
jgi:hypothetical protein